MYNHYIPKFYTKRWTGADGRLVRYWRPYNRVVFDRKTRSRVGGQDNLYKIPHLYDGTENRLETEFFAKVDQNASNVMDKIEKDGVHSLSDAERRSWSSFIISLRQRNPESLKEIGDRAEIAVRQNLEKYRETYSNRRHSHDPTSYEEFLSSKEITERISQARVEMLEHAVMLPLSTAAISDMMWKVVPRNTDSPEFLTSDRPVFIEEKLAEEGGFLALPLSPRSIFFASRSVSILAEKSNKKNLSIIANEIVVSAAVKEVFGTDMLQVELVENKLRPPLSVKI